MLQSRLINFRYAGPKESSKINYMIAAISTDLDNLTEKLKELQSRVSLLARQIADYTTMN